VGSNLLCADKSLDEDRFARVALWGELVTSQQFEECVDEQKARAAAGRDVPSLPQLFIEKGYLRHEQAAAIFKVMTRRTPEQWRNQFGQLALRKDFITEDQLRDCLELQTKLIMSTGSAPFLGHLLIEHGYLTESQALAILKAQEQRHIGILHDLEAAMRPPSGKIADFLRRHPRVLVAAAFLAVALVAGGVGAWLHAYATAPPTFDLLCDQCGHRLQAPASAITEPCPHCGRGQMCTPLRCSSCGVAFPLKIYTSHKGGPWINGCPKCASLRHVELPPGLGGLTVKPRPQNPPVR